MRSDPVVTRSAMSFRRQPPRPRARANAGAGVLLLVFGGCQPLPLVEDEPTDGDDSTGSSSATGDDGSSGNPPMPGTSGSGRCGNGKLEPNEECDLGVLNADNAGCTSECRLAVCGDGILYIGHEACDPAGETAACNVDCTLAACGDGIVNASAGESCEEYVPHGTCTDCRFLCDSGFEDCNGDVEEDGCEADLATNATCGACDVTCTDTEVCMLAGCRLRKLVFVSSLHRGELGGVSGADTICQAEAERFNLSGTFQAWIAGGTPQSAPASRFTRNPGPYVLVDGTIIAQDWDDLVDGEIDAPIRLHANGGSLTGRSYVFTNVADNGTQADATDHCDNWTSNRGPVRIGRAVSTNDDWTDGHNELCENMARLYCFEK